MLKYFTLLSDAKIGGPVVKIFIKSYRKLKCFKQVLKLVLSLNNVLCDNAIQHHYKIRMEKRFCIKPTKSTF
jgi:hypothetical protein